MLDTFSTRPNNEQRRLLLADVAPQAEFVREVLAADEFDHARVPELDAAIAAKAWEIRQARIRGCGARLVDSDDEERRFRGLAQPTSELDEDEP